MRTAAVWVPDWPVAAGLAVADIPAHLPAAILRGNRIQVANASARCAGVRGGMRKRTAQGMCPQLVCLRHDEHRDAAQFEPVARVIEQVVAGLEVMRPGLVLLPAQGAARYHGGEVALAAQLVEACASVGFESQVGVADSMFAAILAAREQTILAPNQSLEFISQRPTSDLLVALTDRAKLRELQTAVELWQRLGIHTLGDLLALPSQSLTHRFGHLGIWARQLATGADVRPPALHRPETELQATFEFDPPADRMESAALAAGQLAEELSALLAKQGLACGLLRVTAVTEHGESARVWRGDDAAVGGLSAEQMALRVRWQLEGWLSGSSRIGASIADPAPILRLSLTASDAVPAAQPQFFGSSTQAVDNAARRAVERVQAIIGQDGIKSAAVQGGRTPAERIRLCAAGEQVIPERTPNQPWPSALPDPAPTYIYSQPAPARLLSHSGASIVVNPRLPALSEPPTILTLPALANEPSTHESLANEALAGETAGKVRVCEVLAWAGPWLVPARWWEGQQQDAAYLQVVTQHQSSQVGSAWLLESTGDQWAVVGAYC